MLAPTLPHSRRPQQRRVRRGVGPTTATVEDTVASVDTAVDLDGQGQVLGAETEPADEAEWPYDWRKQLRVALCGEHFRQFKRGNPPPSYYYVLCIWWYFSTVLDGWHVQRICFFGCRARDWPGLRTAAPIDQDDVQEITQ